VFGPDHLAGLRGGIDHQAWVLAAGAGAFGDLAVTQARDEVVATVDGMRVTRPLFLHYFFAPVQDHKLCSVP
jgi:hypothetical protein